MDSLTARLAQLAALNQTTHYGALTRDLNLTGPATIARLTAALEGLMEQDVAAGHPIRAALITARNSPLPAPGFFAKAAALGLTIPDPTTFIAEQRAALHTFILVQVFHGGPGV
jgi:hypothetical protein